MPDNADIVAMSNSLKSESSVDEVHLNYYVKLCWTYPNDPGLANHPLSESMWYYELLNIFDVWDITTGDPDIKVAIIDAGCNWDEEDLLDTGISYNVIDGSNNVTPLFYPAHGTRMTSIIGARTNNSKKMCGIAGGWGNAAGVSIMMIKASTNNLQDTLETQYLDDAVKYAYTHGARIINMSWGNFGFDYEPLHEQIDSAYISGVVMFASVGNYNNSEPNDPLYDKISWPASDEYVIAVGGTNQFGGRWHFAGSEASSFGVDTEISTIAGGTSSDPLGMFVLNNVNDLTYQSWKTSGATATATAIASLMLSVNPCLTPDQVREILIASCEQVGGYNYQWSSAKPNHSKELGYGRVNALTAVTLAQSAPGFTVNNNEVVVWDFPKSLSDNITVRSGGTLIIKDVVRMSPGKKIIVEEGGVLELNDAIITSMCSDEGLWAGIEVHGNPSLSQISSTNQGRLSISNSTIENASVGIGVCDNLSQISISGFVNDGGGGGIIEASDLVIKNCEIGVTFAPYDLGNVSYFKRGSIVFDDDALEPTFAGGMFLNNINDLSLIGTKFQNLSDKTQGYGIRSLNSNFSLDYFCDEIDAPCQTGFGIRCLFENFNYGISAENPATNKFVTVKNTKFDSNTRGFYGSGLRWPFLFNNEFILPNVSDTSYGMYLNDCDQYTVENNIFNSDQYSSSTDIGIYIRNSGGLENEIYNNKFQYLKNGAVAYGINRNYYAQTGLCFKCNDFVGCVYDITVPEIVNPPISSNHGIRRTQGTVGSLNTDAAGNTFSLDGVNNFDNQINYVKYVSHENANPYSTKIVPNPHSNSVTVSPNNGTTYIKQESCPTHSFNESKEELVEAKSIAEQEISTAQVQLSSFVDGGNTEELNDNVESAFPSQSLEVYQDLMSKSPYLSDEVMKTGIEKTDVLVDAMLRDVLVANPSSAKSEDVMQKLNERTIPLPDEMMSEVSNGVNLLSSKDLLEMQLVKGNEAWYKAQRGILQIYSHDTIPERRTDSIIDLLSETDDYHSKLQLALIQCDLGNSVEANQILAAIPIDYELDDQQLEEYSAYSTLINALNLLKVNDEYYFDADALRESDLMTLAQNDDILPGAIARNILHAAGVIQYTEPIILGNENKSSPVELSSIEVKRSDKKHSLEVYPNPATNYCIVRYKIPETSNSGMIKIIDHTGKNLFVKQLNDKMNSEVVPLDKFPSGSYGISLIVDGKTEQSVQLSIIL